MGNIKTEILKLTESFKLHNGALLALCIMSLLASQQFCIIEILCIIDIYKAKLKLAEMSSNVKPV
jgi:hypothetical protein